MSLGSWLKGVFLEEDNKVEDVKEEKVEDSLQNYDYSVKIFDIIKKDDVNKVTNYIIQDKTLALIKMHKFIGNKDDLKDVLNELKTTCDNCNSKVLGITNNMYFVTKKTINVEKEEASSLEI
ncbi:MAG: hypothetical protein AABW56_01285 [Nanoarchaeota archaeon]